MATSFAAPSAASAIALALLLSLPNAAHADELGEVQRLYYAGQPATAMQRADAYLEQHPKDAPMRFIKGVMLTDAKRNDEAIALFRKLSEDYPGLAEPYNNLAALYASAGNYTMARATLEQALRTNPSYATAHENLGDVYAALAAQSYARALKLDPASTTLPPKIAAMRDLYKRTQPTDTAGGASAASAPSPGDTK